MELEDFVKATILAIMSGVAESQKEAFQYNAAVIPHKETPIAAWAGYQIIEFDVEVSASESAAKKGGAGIIVGPVAIGGRADASEHASSVARIKFKIPVRFSYQPKEK